MSIIQTVNFHTFQEAFKFRKDNFSYEGLNVLYEMLEQLSEDTGENIELDPIGLCCEYAENTLEGFINENTQVLEEYHAKYNLFLNEYLTDYIYDNIENLLKDQDIVKEYFAFILNKDTNYYEVLDNPELEHNFDFHDLSIEMQEYLTESMEHNKFMQNIIDIQNDIYYMEAVDNIRLEVIEEYLNYHGGSYNISDCKTFLIYQQF